MHILLPPSETKLSSGYGANELRLSTLAHAKQLNSTREYLISELNSLVANEKDTRKLAKLFGVGSKSINDLKFNFSLRTANVMPAAKRYTGSLYKAMDYEFLNKIPGAINWMHTHVSIQSALFGLISAADEIPAYRFSAKTRLPKLNETLKVVWKRAHKDVHDLDRGLSPNSARLVLDMRSRDYADLNPLTRLVENGAEVWYFTVKQENHDGTFTALSHFNKSTKGSFLQGLAVAAATDSNVREINNITSLQEWASSAGIRFNIDESKRESTVILKEANKSGRQ